MSALTIISTDWHLKPENLEEIIDLVRQKCKLAKKLGIKDIFCLGDVFDSRIAQRQSVLKAFERILGIIEEYGLVFHLIPGNHDKTVYPSMDSFLDAFKTYPCLRLYRKHSIVKLGKFNFHLIPFFEEKVWLEIFHGIEKGGKNDILLSHMAVEGSRNNDGSLVSSGLTPKMFENWLMVLLGHYHDEQQIGKNIFHIPSIKQNNYGEDENKGFTVLNSDGSYEVFKSNYKAFKRLKINIDETPQKELEKLVKTYSKNEDRIRFEFTGDSTKLKALDKSKFNKHGIEIKTKVKEIEESIVECEKQDVKIHNQSTIMSEFKKYHEIKSDFNLKLGTKYLKEHFNGEEK